MIKEEKDVLLKRRQRLPVLRESKYHLLLNHISDAVFIHHVHDKQNMTGKFIEVNDAACRNLGYTKEELLRMSLPDIAAPETAALAPLMMKKLFRDKRAIWEGTHISKNGRRIPVEINNVLFYLNAEPVILSTVRDISQRKQAQEEKRQNAEELRFIAEHVGDIIWQMDENIYFTYVSPAVQRIMGYQPPEVVGRSLFSLLTTRSAGEITPLWLEWYKQLAEGIQSDELLFEIEAVHKDGHTVWMEVQARPLVNGEGRVTRYHGVARDITQRRQLMERLNRAEKMESLGIMAGGVAHDLNNVLGVIVGYSELIMKKIPAENLLNKYAAGIVKSSEKSAAIIHDLLALARRGVTVCETIDLNAVVAEYLKSPEFERLKTYHQRVIFTSALACELLPVQGSAVHISKMIMNLLSNAAESITARGNVKIATEKRRLDKTHTGYEEVQPGEYVVMTVSDNGQGISPEDQSKIFEPFYTKKVMGRSGTGLGLAVVWGTVKDYNGYIDVQTEQGKGSSFSVFFPAAVGQVKSENKKITPDSYMGKGESVLVVDDVPDQRDVAAAILKSLGYKVKTLSGGEEAVAYLGKHRVDLVVIDMIMEPGMDGLDTYREIGKIRPGQKAIIVSGYSETDRVKQALQLGVGAYLHKPYTLEKIGLAIRCELDR